MKDEKEKRKKEKEGRKKETKRTREKRERERALSMRPHILWHVLGAYFLLIWGVGLSKMSSLVSKRKKST